MAMLSMEATAKDEPKVTAVYGVSVDDYLPSGGSVQTRPRSQVRSSASRPSLDLPDAFYFIGGPIFLLLFMRVIVIFLNEFEQKRKEEQSVVTRESWDTE